MNIYQALLDNYLEIYQVNLKTGNINFIKNMYHGTSDNISNYCEEILNNIYEEDKNKYIKLVDLNYVSRKIAKDKIIRRLRMKVNGLYKWIYFETIKPADFDKNNPNILYTFKLDDKNIGDITKILLESYVKVLKINLSNDSFSIIKILDDESSDSSINFSTWINNFVAEGNIFKQDEERFMKTLNVQMLKKYFKTNKKLELKYRRKIDDEFKYVCLEISKSTDYTKDNKNLLLKVTNIHETYSLELERKRILEEQAYYDKSTGLLNMNSYINFCEQYVLRKDKNNVAVLFADLNGLKRINDIKGHEEGDKYICKFTKILKDFFGKYLCYRRSGDEFIVIMDKENEEQALKHIKAFKNYLKSFAYPLASVGYCWRENPISIQNLINEAEKYMYKEKLLHYKQYPKFIRTPEEK